MRQLQQAPSAAAVRLAQVNWRETRLAEHDLLREVEAWLANTNADQFEVYWCAGRATPRSSDAANFEERHFFATFLQALRQFLSPIQSSRLTIFFSSSAGGVYGDTGLAVANEGSKPRPSDGYGTSKVSLELMLSEYAEALRCRAVIGRITSLYGTDQIPNKPQGLFAHLANAVAVGLPLELFASLSTTRNYLDVETAARITISLVRASDSRLIRTRNICAPQNVSIAELLNMARQLSGRRVLVRQVAIENAANSRIETCYPEEVAHIARATLAEGMSSLIGAARLRILTPTTGGSSARAFA